MTRPRSGFRVLCIVVSVVLATWAGLAQQPRQVDENALKSASRNGSEWLTYGRDYAETRYSPLKLIDTANVGRLGLTWSYEVGAGGGNQEGTPLVSNGVMYGVTNWSIVFSLDARTGQERWRWDPQVNRVIDQQGTDQICCGVVNRGIALYEGKLIVPVIDGRLVALDAQTGKQLWSAQATPAGEISYTLTMAPRVIKNKVIVGNSGAEFPPYRGYFSAFDVNTGREVWRFYTVPGDPSKPFENPALEKAAKTWSGEWWKYGGGGSVWDALSYDPEADLVYVGTGNGAPWPEELRQSKGMDNLYVASILAVDPDNGELKWHYQVVPGDSWDYDSVQQLLLADVRIGGRDRKVLMQANKNGFFYVLDRITGEFISAEPFANVTWAKGIDSKTGRPIVNPQAYYQTGAAPVSISPGPGGAHNWSPMAFNPATGLVYLPVTASSSFTFSVNPNFQITPGVMNLGTGRGGGGGGAPAPAAGAARGAAPGPGDSPEAAQVSQPARPPAPLPAIGPQGLQGGYLVAWDPVTQKERWRVAGGGGSGGGTVTTAGNLVFQTINDGRLLAYSADEGAKLLEVQTGQRGLGPPITFELDGKQYVTLMGGQGQRGGGAAAGNAPVPPPGGAATPAPPPARPRIYTFVLDGKAPMIPGPPPAP